MRMKKIFETTYALTSIHRNVAELLQFIKLDSTKPLIISLEGDLGAGKTILVREILYSLGLSKKIPVLSPTFSYYQIYEIDDKKIMHADFYRANRNLGQEFSDVLGEVTFAFIEWMKSCDLGFSPQYIIKLEYIDENHRKLECFEI